MGDTTAGVLSLWFDGSDVGLSTAAEDVDAVGVLADGRPVLSTLGGAQVPAASAADEDLLVFTPTSLGPSSAGTWTLSFDGSDVGLGASSENVDGADPGSDGAVRLSTTGAFSVPGGTPVIAGGDEDAFTCLSLVSGGTTQCTWAPALVLDGTAAGLAPSVDVDGLARR